MFSCLPNIHRKMWTNNLEFHNRNKVYLLLVDICMRDWHLYLPLRQQHSGDLWLIPFNSLLLLVLFGNFCVTSKCNLSTLNWSILFYLFFLSVWAAKQYICMNWTRLWRFTYTPFFQWYASRHCCSFQQNMSANRQTIGKNRPFDNRPLTNKQLCCWLLRYEWVNGRIGLSLKFWMVDSNCDLYYS